MKTQPIVWILWLMGSLFLSACAGQYSPGQSSPDRPITDRLSTDRPTKGPPQTAPSKNLPQIGVSQASVSREAPRRKIIIALTKKAEEQIRSNKLAAAFTTLEQGIGIDPQDPFLWHLMARVQLLQGNLHQARDLAKKSNLLAGRYQSLQKKNFKIIDQSLGASGSIPKGLIPPEKSPE